MRIVCGIINETSYGNFSIRFIAVVRILRSVGENLARFWREIAVKTFSFGKSLTDEMNDR